MAIISKNIKLIAFLRLKGIYPVKVTKVARGKAEYNFDISDQQWEALKSEFDRSDYLAYAQALDAVIDLAY